MVVVNLQKLKDGTIKVLHQRAGRNLVSNRSTHPSLALLNLGVLVVAPKFNYRIIQPVILSEFRHLSGRLTIYTRLLDSEELFIKKLSVLSQ